MESDVEDDTKEYWFPKLADHNYCDYLRDEYPDKRDLNDDDLLRYFGCSSKYVTTWDHIGDAYSDYEPLADAYLKLLEKLKTPN